MEKNDRLFMSRIVFEEEGLVKEKNVCRAIC